MSGARGIRMQIVDKLIRRVLDQKARLLRRRFRQAAQTPATTQWGLLEAILRREANSGFGRDHGFANIRSIDDFRRQIPIAGYERMAPYIDRVAAGESSALFTRDRLIMFALTSGTNSRRKLIPVTQRSLAAHRRGWFLWALAAFGERVDLLFRPKVNFTGDEAEFYCPSGIPCGSISGLTARMQPGFVRRSYVLPLAASKIEETRSKYYLAWRLGLMRDVASWMSPNPSTHLALARLGDVAKESLIRDVRDGTCAVAERLPPELVHSLERQWRPDRKRARRLEEIIDRTGHLYPKDIWPDFGLLACWLGGPLAGYLKYFPDYFGAAPRRDLGLIASEGRMTIPLADETASAPLDLLGMFFEFVPVDEMESMESRQPIALLPEELAEGRDYSIVLTSPGGLYRYHIQDVVRCTGWFHKSPLIEFLNKGRHISSLTGEKLSEHQVSQAVTRASEALGIRLGSYALAPRFDDGIPSYGLLLERQDLPRGELADQLAERLDDELSRLNCEYEAKRKSARLAPVHLRLLPPGTWERFDRQRIAASGGSPEQYKRPRLLVDLDVAASLSGRSEMSGQCSPISAHPALKVLASRE